MKIILDNPEGFDKIKLINKYKIFGLIFYKCLSNINN